MSEAKLLEAGIVLLGTLAEKGVPALIRWNDGTEITDLTPEELDKLKVKKMSEKREDE